MFGNRRLPSASLTASLALRLVHVATAAVAAGGCSFAVVNGPPPRHEQLPYFTCTDGKTIPVLETTLGALLGVSVASALAQGGPDAEGAPEVGVVAAAMVASSIYGFIKVDECRAAKAQLQARLDVMRQREAWDREDRARAAREREAAARAEAAATRDAPASAAAPTSPAQVVAEPPTAPVVAPGPKPLPALGPYVPPPRGERRLVVGAALGGQGYFNSVAPADTSVLPVFALRLNYDLDAVEPQLTALLGKQDGMFLRGLGLALMAHLNREGFEDRGGVHVLAGMGVRWTDVIFGGEPASGIALEPALAVRFWLGDLLRLRLDVIYEYQLFNQRPFDRLVPDLPGPRQVHGLRIMGGFEL